MILGQIKYAMHYYKPDIMSILADRSDYIYLNYE